MEWVPADGKLELIWLDEDDDDDDIMPYGWHATQRGTHTINCNSLYLESQNARSAVRFI